MNKIWIKVFLIFTAAAVLLSGCGKTPDTKKVSVAMIKLTSSAPIFIGMEKGFFREEGIEIDPQWFEAAQPIAVATASIRWMWAPPGLPRVYSTWWRAGRTLVIVADKGREQKGFSSSTLLVTTDPV